tara:strand:- start:8963 stop:9877 length:915 start_codon:yes stop_codon:yes gene_type:complete
MKIIIIGCGMIGFSHLKSFLNSKNIYEIDIIDNKKRLNELKKILKNKKNLSLNLSTKIPRKKKFDFAIFASNSKERLSLLKNFLKNGNKFKYILLEKFIFPKKNDFLNFEKYFNKYLKNIYINSFASYIYKKLEFKKLKINKIEMIINTKNGTLFTNLIHYLDLFYQLTSSKPSLKELKIKKIFNFKRYGYKEALGSLKFINKKGELEINSHKKIDLNILVNLKKNTYKIILKKNYLFFYKNNKISKKIIFPFAYNFTEKGFLNLIKKNNQQIYFSKYKNISELSKIILDMLNLLSSKKPIQIT